MNYPYALFCGRLSREKGIETLLKALEMLPERVELKIAGDGQLSDIVQSEVNRKPGVTWLGQLNSDEVLSYMAKALLLVFPSECYETFGLTIIESFSQGTPVVASNIRAMRELVTHNHTGLHFETGNPQDLAEKLEWGFKHPEEMARMGRNAKVEFATKYTPERNYKMLMDIYESAIITARG